jgi:hypothetical protein
MVRHLGGCAKSPNTHFPGRTKQAQTRAQKNHRTLSASAWTENQNKFMNQKSAPSEGQNSEQTTNGSTSDDAACCACGSAMHMAVTGGIFWKCGSRKTRKGEFRTELCHAREALKHVHSILSEKREQGRDLKLGSTAFKSCLRWSSIYQHNADVMARGRERHSKAPTTL